MKKFKSIITYIVILFLPALSVMHGCKSDSEKARMALMSDSLDSLDTSAIRCNDDNRYLTSTRIGIEEIPLADATKEICDYRNDHVRDTSPYKTTGFHISKRVIDEIFENCEYNSLSADLVFNYDPETKSNKLTLVVSGETSNSANVTILSTPSNVFRVLTVCPLDCKIFDCGGAIDSLRSDSSAKK